MDKMKMQTQDLAEEKYKKLAELFPDAVTETIDEDGNVVRAIDKDVLMQDINTSVVDDGQERYQFTWPDKKKSVVMANAPIAKTLRLDRAKSVGKDGTQGCIDSENIYIEGDNLDALKLLQETYLGKVDVIYIDPPYNTGNNLIYKNDYYQNMHDYFENSGQFDEDGNKLVPNPTSNGRRHTDWLNMMYVRLKVAKDLLTMNGIICLTIDDFEIANITKMMDEIFGEANHLGTVIIKNNPQGRSSVTGFQISHEYALFYSRSNESQIGRLPRNEEQLARYNENDSVGPFEWRNFRAQYSTESPKMVYPIYVKKDSSDFRIPRLRWNEAKRTYDVLEEPLENEIVSLPVDGDGRMRTWKWSIETVNLTKEKEMGVRKDRGGVPTVYFKGRMKDDGMLPYTVWDKPEYSSSTFGANVVAELMGKGIFSYPKSIYAVIDCLKVGGSKKDSVIMDFFSGSATTADATMQLNLDGGNRKYILVQFPESIEDNSEACKAGYETICDIGEERIRRSGRKIKDESPLITKDFDIGFRVFKVDTTNMEDIYYKPADFRQEQIDMFAENIKPDRTQEDLLFQVMLDLGILLSSDIKETTIAGKKVFSVADGYLIACFDSDVTDETVTEIAKQHPFYAVFRDSGMANDSVMTNFDQIFETYSPKTQRKVL
mgnify:CR=1 FL=1